MVIFPVACLGLASILSYRGLYTYCIINVILGIVLLGDITTAKQGWLVRLNNTPMVRKLDRFQGWFAVANLLSLRYQKLPAGCQKWGANP